MSDHFWMLNRRFVWQVQKKAKREGFVAVSKALAAVGRLKKICKDAFRVAGAYNKHVHQRC